MNNLTRTLLGSVALCALATVPAMAQHRHPAFSVTALHAGKAVNKTNMHNQKAQHLTYTFGVYTYVSFASSFHKKVPLAATFYRWNSYSTACSSPKLKKIVPKKTEYAKLGTAVETYSFGCPSGPTVFHGVTYKITNPDAKGATDHFVATYITKFRNSHGKYKGTLNLDVTVDIE